MLTALNQECMSWEKKSSKSSNTFLIASSQLLIDRSSSKIEKWDDKTGRTELENVGVHLVKFVVFGVPTSL